MQLDYQLIINKGKKKNATDKILDRLLISYKNRKMRNFNGWIITIKRMKMNGETKK